MNYAFHILRLQAGETTQFRPHGQSMTPRINSGDLVTVAPITRELEIDDIVLCRVKGNYFVHLVKAVQDNRIQIGNNHGFINGWTHRNKVYGIVTNVEP